MIFPNKRSSEKHKFLFLASNFLENVDFDNLPIDQISAITELINALVENNLWEKFIAIYPFVGYEDKEKNSLNLIDSSKYKISWQGEISFGNFGVTGLGGIGNTNIPFLMLKNFNNLHLSVYVSSNISNAIGNGRLIGANTTDRLTNIKDICATELNFNKTNGLIGFVYNIINTSGGFGMTYNDIINEGINGNGFFIANSNGETKDAKCYFNGSVFGYQFPLLPTETHPQNPRQITIFGDGYEENNTTPLSNVTLSFASVGYGLTANDIYNFNKIIQTFHAGMNRTIM